MSIQPLLQALPTGARTTQRRRLLAGIGLLAIVAALTVAFFAAPDRAPQVQRTQAIFIDPATQGVNSYLRVHTLAASVAPSDPATQSVNSYLRVHGWDGTHGAR